MVTGSASARANGAVVPGKPEDSEVLRRVLSADPQEVMPPPKTGKTVSPRERELLRAWIAAGAKFERHWAFTRVERPPVPAVADKARVRNPVDAFVQARLQRDKVLPSSMAPPHVLARRLSLDLTGLQRAGRSRTLVRHVGKLVGDHLAAAETVDAQVAGDPEKPSANLRPRLPAFASAPEAQECLLGDVVGFRSISHHAVRKARDGPEVAAQQLGKRLAVVRPQTAHQVVVALR